MSLRLRRLALLAGICALFLLPWAEKALAAELSYVTFTSDVTVSATAEATPDTVVTAGAISADGSTEVSVEFGCQEIQSAGSTGARVFLNLWDGSTDLGRIASVRSQTSSALATPCYIRRYLTPTNGSHTYSVRAWRSLANGTIVATSPAMPGYIRVSDDAGSSGSTTLAALTDVDTTGVVNGAVLKYDSGLAKWIDGTDNDSGGAGGAVALADADRERLDLIWWGVWGSLGLTLVLIFAAKWHGAWRFMRE